MSIGVLNDAGENLFLLSTEIANRETHPLCPLGSIRCVIPRLPLTQGRYFLTLYLEVNKEAEDWVESAVSLDVEDGDFFGTGKQYPPDGTWKAGRLVSIYGNIANP